MRQPVVRCVEFVETVTEWMEGALVDDERLALEEHLVICPHCTEYVAQLRLSRAVLQQAADVTAGEAPPPAARAALLEAFRRERRRQG
jgi:anti-sigma factor RsiW